MRRDGENNGLSVGTESMLSIMLAPLNLTRHATTL